MRLLGSFGAAGGGGVIVTHRPGATQAEVKLGCVLPPGDARADAVYDVAADLVDGDLSEELRQRIGSTYGVHVRATTRRGGTSFLRTEATVDNGRLPQVLGLVAGFWDRVVANGVGAHDVELTRDMLATKRLLRYQSSTAVANALVRYWNNGWPLAAIDEAPATLAAVRAADVDAALRACARSMVVAITGDEGVVRAALAAKP